MPPFLGGFQMPGPIITPSKYGLITVTDPVELENGPWMDEGIIWDEDLCSDIHSNVEGCPSVPVSKVTSRDFQSCMASPFTIYASYDCPPVGNTAEDAFRIAKRRLEIRENREMEKVFWTGLTEDGTVINPSLAFGNSECGGQPIDLTPEEGPLGPAAALGVLESNLAECTPGSGVIHANYGLAQFLATNYLIYPGEKDSWFTVTGQRLALGKGYPGSGPAGIPAEPGATWMFGTGPIVIWRSDIFLTPERFKEAMDKSLNSVTVFAERVYALGWSCCLFAIQVRICADI